MIAALTADKAVGQEINLGHSHPIEMRRLIGMLEEALGKKAIIDQQPPRSEDLPITRANLDKAGRLLGYQPQVSLEEGIPQYVAWYRQWHG